MPCDSIEMKTTHCAAVESIPSSTSSTFTRRLKVSAVALLLATVGFLATGCYDDPYYYGHRSVRAGYYAAPAPYYGYDPYPYGYGYGTGVAIGVSSYRGGYRYAGRPYYGDRYYGRSRYYRGDRHYRGSDGRRSWERRRYRNRDRSSERPARGERNRVIRRSTAPETEYRAPVETQPE